MKTSWLRRSNVGLLRLEPLEDRRLLSTFTVNSVGDFVDSDTNTMSLREAIIAANANADSDRIEFNIPGTGVQTIQPTSALPAIINPVVIDGYSQPGASENTNPMESGLNSMLMVELDGSEAGSGTNGLRITGGGSTVRGLVINRFAENGVVIDNGAHDNQIVDNLIMGNLRGIFLSWTADNQILRNVVSGNQYSGIRGVWSARNLIEGNFIGTDATGTQPLGNGDHGVLFSDSSENQVLGNVVSASRHGANIRFYNQGSWENLIQGNKIGTDATGTLVVLNASDTANGVAIDNGAHDNQIVDNVISGNHSGIRLVYGAADNLVQNNKIGTDVTGSIALGNNQFGVMIASGASGNQIIGNVVSASQSWNNIVIDGAGSTGNLLRENMIGTDATGRYSLSTFSTSPVVVGVAIASAASANQLINNVISGNTGWGVYLASSGNRLEGNLIGTDASGANPLGNGGHGVGISGSSNQIEANTIAFNAGDGVSVGSGSYNQILGNVISANEGYANIYIGNKDSSCVGNIVQGNKIGTDATGRFVVGNPATRTNGVVIDLGARDSQIVDNVISGNHSGIRLVYGAAGNLVRNNKIGTDVTGSIALGNNHFGVMITSGASGNQIIGNVVTASKTFTNIQIAGNQTINNALRNNMIGTDATGSYSLTTAPNVRGISVDGNAAATQIIGNVISGNTGYGVALFGPGSTIQGNKIGIDATGSLPVGNGSNGIFISTWGTANGSNTAVMGNTIAFNVGPGVGVGGTNAPTGNSIRQNTIYANGGLGIDLTGNFTGDGVTPNDLLLDADTGANNSQNFPVLRLVEPGLTTHVVGVLDSAASTAFTIDFYLNDEVDPSGYGEGQLWVGELTVTTDSSGHAVFDKVLLGVSSTLGQFLTATATDPGGNTSEFSLARVVNTLPIAQAGGPYIGTEGSEISFDASPSSDPDGSPLTYRWDLDGDGTFDTEWSSFPTAARTWADNWSGTAIVQVSDGFDTAEAVATVTINDRVVQIDVKPGDSIPSLNLASNGVIAVVLYSTTNFDARLVDISSVTFAGATVAMSSFEDVDGDGDLDAVFHFETQQTNLQALYVDMLLDDHDADGVLDSTRQLAEVTLSGQTTDNLSFVGTDQLNLFLSGKKLRNLLDQLHAQGLL